jgi:hypothetical protein
MEYSDPKKIEEAKRLAAGPLGEKLSKFPMLFAKAALIGERPKKNSFTKINNATVTLVNLGSGPIMITCYHVLEGYRELINGCESAWFQVGDVDLNPLEQLIAESKRLDLATIKLTDSQANDIVRGGEIGSCFFKPSIWPSPSLNEGDFVAFGGFPGQWRERWAFDEIVFPSFSSGACRVAQVSDDRFACQFEREYWITVFNIDNREHLHDLGGMSGGPAFIHRGIHWDFIGIIYEFSSSFDIMYLRPAHLIYRDGSIYDPLA